MKKVLSLFAVITLLSGCAHPIDVAPNQTKLLPTTNTQKINARIAYYIPAELMSLEVTTPGGGGDNVRYKPYKAIEVGYAQILNNTFTNVHKLNTENDVKSATSENIDYIIQPVIITSSGSTGFFTWPPTNFTVDLTSEIKKLLNKKTTSIRVVGTGSSDLSEQLLDHGITGKKAMEDALLKTQNSLLNLDFFSKNE